MAEWPIEDVRCAVDKKDIGDSTGTFRVLRKVVIAAAAEEIQANSAHAPLIWMYLLEFCGIRKVYRRQVLEVVTALFECKAWEEAFAGDKGLEAKAKALPEDVQRALALQHETLAKSMRFTPEQMEGFRKSAATAAEEDMPADVTKSLARARHDVKNLNRMQADASQDQDAAPQVPAAFAPEAHGGETDDGHVEAYCEEMRDAIEAVLDIDDAVKFENNAISAFAGLRRTTLHIVEFPQVLERESAHAPAVFSFLIDFTKRHRIRIRQICEVLNLLMGSHSWAASFEGSSMLVGRVRDELSEDAQAAFGLQNEKIMSQLPTATQKRAREEAEKKDGDIAEAAQAAKQMDDLCKSFRPPTTKPAAALAAVGKAKDAAAAAAGAGAAAATNAAASAKDQAGAAADAGAAKVASAADEWREAKTQGDKVYYYNVRTRETAWKLPAGAVLAASSAAKAAAAAGQAVAAVGQAAEGKAGYAAGQPEVAATASLNVRDQVEIYSNSNKIWCRGVVEKQHGANLIIAFQLPGAKPDDWCRKELAPDSDQLRKATHHGGGGAGHQSGGGGSEDKSGAAGGTRISWSSREQQLYSKYWELAGAGLSGQEASTATTTFLGRAGLHRRSLREVWGISASAFGSKTGIGQQEFYMLCRLVGHCQSLQTDKARADLLSTGGVALRNLLLKYCVSQPPPQDPRFNGS